MAAKPEMKTAATASCEISYREVGSGPALLCLHGGGPGASGWSNFGDNAADLSDKYRVIIPDLPGWGESRIVDDSGDAYQDIAVTAMLELLGILGVERTHVIGNSSGGGIGALMAARNPSAVDRLVMMGAFAHGFRQPILSSGPTEGQWHLINYYPDPSIAKMRALIRTFVYDASDPRLEDVVTSRFEASVQPNAVAGYARAHRPNASARPDSGKSVFDEIASVEAPTLLLWGRDDRFCPIEDGLRFLAVMPRSELAVLRDCGHWVQVEKRPEFMRLLTSFLAG